MCALERFAEALALHPEQMSWLKDVAQGLVENQAQAPQALREYYHLSEEKEALELWLAEREKEYLSGVQQLRHLIEETQGMDTSLRTQYQATLLEIDTHFA